MEFFSSTCVNNMENFPFITTVSHNDIDRDYEVEEAAKRTEEK